jgi:AmpE protein
MKLIVILICLAALRYIPLGDHSKRYTKLVAYGISICKWTRSIKGGWGQLFIILLPIFVIVFGLQYFLAQGIFYILAFILNVAVLWYSFWPVTLEEQVETGLKASANNPAKTREFVTSLFPLANSEIFAVIFWYMVLGPFGALAYRIIVQLASAPQFQANHAAKIFAGLLDWIPARITALSFIMAGDFVEGFSPWAHHLLHGPRVNEDLLVTTGLGAMNIKAKDEYDAETVRQSLRMIERALIVWIVIIAIFTLGVLI